MEQTTELAVIRADYTPAVIRVDWESIQHKIEAMIEPYTGLTAEVVAKMDMRDAKRCRTHLRQISTELNDARKVVKREYNRPLSEFENKVKELDALILEPWQVLDDAVKLAEENAKAKRRADLEQAYREYAPALVDVVGFDAILEKEWLNKSIGEQKALDRLYEKVNAVARDWEALKKTTLKCPRETEVEFFRTLSLRAAMDFDAHRSDEQSRIDAMKAEVEANRTQMAEVIDVTPEPPVNAVHMEFEPVNVYIIAVEATERQRSGFLDYMRGHGLHGKIVVTAYPTADAAMRCLRGEPDDQ